MDAEYLASEETGEAIDIGLEAGGTGADAVDEDPSLMGMQIRCGRDGGILGRVEDSRALGGPCDESENEDT